MRGSFRPVPVWIMPWPPETTMINAQGGSKTAGDNDTEWGRR